MNALCLVKQVPDAPEVPIGDDLTLRRDLVAQALNLADASAVELALRLKVTLSGQDWVDVSGQNVNKGEALRFLQKRYGVKPDECAAIGDYLNDVERLQSCGQSYAMKNAHPQLFSSATQITKEDNNHFGACRVICRLAGIPMPEKR